MSPMIELLTRLEKSGVPLNSNIRIAMENINPDKFTSFDLALFWDDKPIPFFVTEFGVSKTISAPHMIMTMLYHLELIKGQDILIIGSKGGYLAALCDYIIGEEGTVSILESHEGVRKYTHEKIQSFEPKGSVKIYTPQELIKSDRKYDRILMTGYLKEISEDIEYHIKEGGFILGPLGSSIHQRLVKKEKQDMEWLDTDLGGVVFGPMDLSELEKNPFDPINLIEHMEVALELILEVIDIEDESLERIYDLISAIKNLPEDIPILDELATEDEILEHPLMELLLSEQEWLGPLWPILTGLDGVDIGEIASQNYSNNGGHSDLIP